MPKLPVAVAAGLVCEYQNNPLGLGERSPRLSWRLADDRPGARQTAFRIVAASSPEKLEHRPDLWDSGRIEDSRTLDIEYAGKPLASRRTVWWKVHVWDHRGREGSWSETACFEMGLLRKADWKASWIGMPDDRSKASGPSPFLRKPFKANGNIVRARIHATARGLFEIYLNGQRVGDEIFSPGWTDYSKRIQVASYDVTGLLQPGENVMGSILADGWYAGNLGWGNQRCVYGTQLSVLAQLEIDYADGHRDTVATDGSWRTSEGPIRSADFYHGETYDARRDLDGWCSPGYDDADWSAAEVFPAPAAPLVARPGLPVRKQQEMAVVAQTEPQSGVHVFDLGQNMVGWARVRVRAKRGATVRLRFAEMLKDDGTLYTDNLRSAKCTDYYTCKGSGAEVYEPRFTFHGFRYVEITGPLARPPEAADVTGVVLHSDIPPTGTFECSDALTNQLQRNIVWGQRGNYLEAPTDCPQRDERLGWTGDAQVFIRTGCFNRDVAAFFTKWCIDMADAQFPDGKLPHVAPDVLRDKGGGSAAWSDAAVICPWTIYQQYADLRILERQYSSMAAWVGWQEAQSSNGHLEVWGFGDWLAIDIPNGNCGAAPTPRDLISTAYFARCAGIMAETARLLGRTEDSRRYRKLQARVTAAFNREFVTPSGRVVGDTQTGYLLALGFDLLPKALRPYAVERLVKDIEGRGWKLSTGFVGTPLLAPVLTRCGRLDVAYRLLHQSEYPSWNYSILQGATTMWERWNSYTRDKGFGDAGMNSFNHYAYGAIGEWLFASVAGIDLDPADPGFHHILLQPMPGGNLSWARGELLTRHGRVACGWKIEGDTLQVEATVPPNTRATLRLPGRPSARLKAGTHALACPWPPKGQG